MFILMNIGLKLIVSRAALQFFLCSLWSGQIITLKHAFLSEWQPDTLTITWNYTKNNNDYLFFIMNLILLKCLADKYVSNSTCSEIRFHQPLLWEIYAL